MLQSGCLARLAAAAFLAAIVAAPADAEPLTRPQLVEALKSGGYVLVMRHTRSPMAPPAPAAAAPDNPGDERELDAAGQAQARDFGAAVKALGAPIGKVWSSPTYRALQTIRLAGLPAPQTAPELGDTGQSMTAASGAQAAWLKTRAGEPPRPGTDTLLVTHTPNITAAFGQAAAGIVDGEALVFRPKAGGPAELAGRIKVGDWVACARSAAACASADRP